jgi:hypothetical protein
MASPVATRRDTLTFESDVVYELVLKYATGKQISNGNIMFTTSMDQVFFLRPEAAQKIHALGLQINEPFELVKRNSGIVVRRIGQQPEPSLPKSWIPTAATAQTEEGRDANKNNAAPSSQPQSNTLSGIMAASYIAAMDALMIAADYADAKGITFKITSGEIRSCAHCCFIASTKNGGPSTWQR